MTREKHLEWAKQRALKYWLKGDLLEAVTSLGSDLTKHPELRPNVDLFYYGMMLAKRKDILGVKIWIEGFR